MKAIRLGASQAKEPSSTPLCLERPHGLLFPTPLCPAQGEQLFTDASSPLPLPLPLP
eukprot:CAMPEP_0197549908 /NCGR_PEP_ID=MMETSP1320-20131121/3680_1 /TAXON_ID=91990 /ORGANISM="Bolidomonas sp., Strain RCC2347" /LENGTH=56 /DNA_ID=CAMNT_0043110199 /DNA_START=219 /DNA_END=385 /DNA_ORIENTATION=-